MTGAGADSVDSVDDVDDGVDAFRLFGTDEPLPVRRRLQAGPLAVSLENGNLRSISFGGVEVVRAVNYLARDTAWGTYAAALANMEIVESADAFDVTYDAICDGKEGRYAYRMTIRGEASGRLTLDAAGKAETDFPTNRTGFVVLHPAEAAGGRLTIRHTDGDVERTTFPEAISPDQPAFDIAALTHESAPGMACTVAMEGDAFEMEDQRNWADASFKTYVRPLSKPRPYVIARGASDVQRVTITIEGRAPATAAQSSETARLTLGPANGTMPRLALFLEADGIGEAEASVSALAPTDGIIFRLDPGSGGDGRMLRRAGDLAAKLGATLVVECIFEAKEPRAEAEAFARALRDAAVRPEAILVSPRREFRMRPSNTLPEGERPIGDIAAALRVAGITVPIGLGTPSFFTEFNRNPPGAEADFVFFSIASNVHAADDVSVMETLTVYPAIIESARRLCPNRPIWLGPCTIGMRHNPYGASVAANPDGIRKPASGDDPRQGALFGAAFMAGAAARAVAAGVARLLLAAPTGPFGLLDANGCARPALAVHAWLNGAAGKPCLAVHTGRPDIAVIACQDGEDVTLLAANLTHTRIELHLPGTAWSGRLLGGGADRAYRGSLSMQPYETFFVRAPASAIETV